MSFFKWQSDARNKTRYLLVMMIIPVFCLAIATNFTYAIITADLDKKPWQQYFTRETIIIFTAAIGSIVMLAGLIKTYLLAVGGGKAVAKALGGTAVRRSTSDFYERRLLNIVEEIALASGTLVPSVYILQEEQGINAFAAGFKSSDAVIGVTRGAIEQLNRDELEGVIAHEFSHIAHGDMRLNMRLIGITFGITMLADFGYTMLRSGSLSRSSNAIEQALFWGGLCFFVVGYTGALFGNMIRASINRAREYLADASAVQYTRNNEGIANALKKIGGSSYGACLDCSGAPETSHMMFGCPLDSFLAGIFATHPPLEKRIKKLMPCWDGQYIVPKPTEVVQQTATPQHSLSEQAVPIAGIATVSALEASVQAIGEPSAHHLGYAKALIEKMPAILSQAIHQSNGALCVAMALMLDNQADILKKQCDFIAELFDQKYVARVLELHEQLELAQLLEDRLSVLELTLPTLLEAGQKQQNTLLKVLLKLARADGKLSIDEWVLISILQDTVSKQNKPAGLLRKEKYKKLESVHSEIVILIKALVGMSGMNSVMKRECFNTTLAKLGLAIPEKTEQINFQRLSHALKKVSLLYPKPKQKLLHAFCLCIEHDGQVVMKEAQVLRAIALVMECPVPPLVQGGAS